MEAKDLIIGPIYFLIIYVIGYIVRNRTCKDRQIKAYFMPGLMMKLLGAISLGLIYQFYYGSGDTFSYFLYGSKYIYDAFEESPILALKMIFGDPTIYDPQTERFFAAMLYKNDPHSYFVIRVSGFLGLFTFHSYAANALLFAVISFSGAWLMFLTFYEIYPHLHRKFAIAIFFTPSVFFWGSGLLKDSITFGALGWLFYSIHRILRHKDYSFSNLLILLISGYTIQLVKVYILLCFLPAVLIWTFLIYNDQIKSRITRTLMKPIMFLFAISMGLFAGNFVTKDNERYKLANLTTTARRTSEWLSQVSIVEGGSVYSLGEFDESISGMLLKIPSAINVTIFRPYVWESKNIVMMISALESSYFLFLTLYVIIRIGIKDTFMVIRTNHILIFCFTFSLVFAFAVGISTNNFGTLVRYKIPMMPFYLTGLYMVESYIEIKKRRKREKVLLV